MTSNNTYYLRLYNNNSLSVHLSVYPPTLSRYILAVATSGRNRWPTADWLQPRSTVDYLSQHICTATDMLARPAPSLAVGITGLRVCVNASRRVHTGTHPPHFPLESSVPVEQVSMGRERKPRIRWPCRKTLEWQGTYQPVCHTWNAMHRQTITWNNNVREKEKLRWRTNTVVAWRWSPTTEEITSGVCSRRLLRR